MNLFFTQSYGECIVPAKNWVLCGGKKNEKSGCLAYLTQENIR